MSRDLGRKLPPALQRILNGEELQSKKGKCIPVTTVDAAGWPHPAIFSFRELIAISESRLLLGAWNSSTTSRNLRERGKITILFIGPGMVYYVKGQVLSVQEGIPGYKPTTRFLISVEQVLEDVEPRSPVVSGVVYHSPPEADEEKEWKKFIDALRSAGQEVPHGARTQR